MPRSPKATGDRPPPNEKNKNKYPSGRNKEDKPDTQQNNKLALETRANRKNTGDNFAVYQARKKALYLSARRSAKDLVQSSVTTIEDMQAKLDELKIQQTTFQKSYDDFDSPRLAMQQVVAGLGEVYTPMLEELGEQRSETLEEASIMLKNNAPRRLNALKEFSKNARQQLEQVKQQEKDAQDASNLITHIKSLLLG